MFVSYQITWWQMNVIMLYWTRQLCIQQKCDEAALCVQQIDATKEIKFRSRYMMFVYHCNINNPEYHVRTETIRS